MSRQHQDQDGEPSVMSNFNNSANQLRYSGPQARKNGSNTNQEMLKAEAELLRMRQE